MNVLFLALYPPLPAIDGGRLRTFNILKQAAARHSVTLVCFDSVLASPAYCAQLRSICEVIVVPKPAPERRTLLARLGDLRAHEPIGLRAWRSEPMRFALRDLTRERVFDVAHVDHMTLMVYADELARVPIALTHHNVEALAQQSQLSLSRANPVRRWLDARESERWRQYEVAASRRADMVIAVSDRDAAYFRKAAPGKTLFVVPNGVDTEYFHPQPTAPGATLLFTGSMDYPPNIDAVQWFCDAIWPRIRRARPDAAFIIAGRDPAPAVQALAAHDGVRVTGRVEDVRPYYAEAAVFVAPLRAGGGTRLKILEAMATGVPVVTTTLGCEGLDVIDGRELLVVDSPDDFAAAVVALLANPARRKAMGEAARLTAVSRYDWREAGEVADRALSLAVAPSLSSSPRPVNS